MRYLSLKTGKFFFYLIKSATKIFFLIPSKNPVLYEVFKYADSMEKYFLCLTYKTEIIV